MLTNTTNIPNVSEEYKNDETSEDKAAKQTETEQNRTSSWSQELLKKRE